VKICHFNWPFPGYVFINLLHAFNACQSSWHDPPSNSFSFHHSTIYLVSSSPSTGCQSNHPPAVNQTFHLLSIKPFTSCQSNLPSAVNQTFHLLSIKPSTSCLFHLLSIKSSQLSDWLVPITTISAFFFLSFAVNHINTMEAHVPLTTIFITNLSIFTTSDFFAHLY